TTGKNIREAGKALILLHGRGGSAEDILSLAQYFPVKEFALLAPQAANNTWYPYSFLAPPSQNEPWLSSALSLLKEIVNDLKSQKISAENIFLLGFSQGACLMLEFVARNAEKYGGIAAFTGGLIGDKIYPENYKGNFSNTPVFIGSSNPDMHVPAERVYATTNILREMGAEVTEKIYENMGHTINEDEIEMVKKIIFK
ncbi:MAG: alpha/beta hydrolase, partial [Chitinophagaceae bacterium]